MEKHPSSGLPRFVSLALRVCGGLILAVCIGGPSPGHVGGCAATGAADPVQFCTSKETYICARECNTGRWDRTMCDAMCGPGAVSGRCGGAGFPPGCLPTQVQASACIEALRSEDRLSIPFLMIAECDWATLCGGSALTSSELTSSEPTTTEPDGI